jgi:hypothetical protein
MRGVSDWVAHHLRVVIASVPDPDTLGIVDARVVAAMDPTLDHCESSAVRVQLRARRAVIRAGKTNNSWS